MKELLSNPWFWVDAVGLVIQAGLLYFAAFRMPKKYWWIQAILAVTSILSLFYAFLPAFDAADAGRIRRALQFFILLSLGCFTFLVYRKIPAIAQRFKINWRVLAGGFAAVVVVVWLTVTLILSARPIYETQFRALDRKATKAAVMSDSSLRVGKQTLSTVRSDSAESANRTLMIEGLTDSFQSLVVPLRIELHNVNLKLERLSLDQEKRDRAYRKFIEEQSRRDSVEKK